MVRACEQSNKNTYPGYGPDLGSGLIDIYLLSTDIPSPCQWTHDLKSMVGWLEIFPPQIGPRPTARLDIRAPIH